ncbi:MAG: AAA family ATPase [Bacteroidales bacterium]|nr:AAA family ATPase [Bacteroidales bacterium]
MEEVQSSLLIAQSPRIYLVGYMGSGKSSALKQLGKLLSWETYDLDSLFEEKYKISVQDFFHKYDEAAFRKLESQLLKETVKYENAVIATGGGTPCFYDNMEWMNANGTTIFLKVSTKTAVNRLLNSKKKRPLIEGKSEEQLLEYVERHYGERMPFYEKAQYTVKGENLKFEK